MPKFQAPRGTRDLLPAERHTFLRLESTARDLAERYGYQPIETPLFEESDRGASKNLHHWHYNARSLIRMLEEAGFSEAYSCAYREGRCPDLELLDNRPDESLFVEAIKGT